MKKLLIAAALLLMACVSNPTTIQTEYNLECTISGIEHYDQIIVSYVDIDSNICEIANYRDIYLGSTIPFWNGPMDDVMYFVIQVFPDGDEQYTVSVINTYSTYQNDIDYRGYSNTTVYPGDIW